MLQTIYDLATFIGWLWGNITEIFGNVFLPIKFIYTFLRQFFITAFGPPIATTELWTFPSDVLGLFGGIPYFDIIVQGAIIALTLMMCVYIVKSFLKT